MTPAKTTALNLHRERGQLPRNPTDEERLLYRNANVLRASLLDDSWPKKVAAFRQLYRLNQHDRAIPGPLPEARSQLHRRLHTEEFCEAMGIEGQVVDNLQQLVAQTQRPSLHDEVDGRLDLIYTLLGELLEMGFSPSQIDLMMEEVHCSNMTKVDDEGAPIIDYGGKVLKGPNHQPESLKAMIAEMRVGLDTASDAALHIET